MPASAAAKKEPREQSKSGARNGGKKNEVNMRMLSLMAAAEKLGSCQRQACKAETAAGKVQADQVKRDTDALLAQLVAKQITKQTFLNKLGDIQRHIQGSDTTHQLQICSVAKCKAQVITMLDSYLEAALAACHANDQDARACTRAERAEKIIRSHDNNKTTDDDILSKLQAVAQLSH
jgi:hypothetical protein